MPIFEDEIGSTKMCWQVFGLARPEGDWVEFDISLKNRYFNYKFNEAEFLNYGFLLDLQEELHKFLDNKYEVNTIIDCIEPDWKFQLCNGYVNFIVLHFEGGMTYSSEEYVFYLGKDNVANLVKYLDKICPLITDEWNKNEKVREEADNCFEPEGEET